MSIYLVSYDLKKTKDYQPLWDELKRVEGHKTLDSVYLVNVNLTKTSDVIAWLKKFVDNDDLLIAVKFQISDFDFLRAKAGTIDWLAKNKVFA